MKSMKYFFLLLISILVFSCENEQVLNEETVNFESETLKSELINQITIKKEELPDLSLFSKGKIGFVLDDSKDAILNKTENVLRIPINTKTSSGEEIFNINNKESGICIRIARRTGGSCAPCVCGIGFNCKVFACDDDGQELRPLTDRTLSSHVTLSENLKFLEFNFNDKVNWEYFEN